MAKRPGTAQPTIADVAAHAGVSSATVSRVINSKATVDAAMVERVRESILALGYAPSAAARSLSLGRSNTIAVIVPDLDNPMFHGVLKGVSAAAAVDGYRVLVAETSEDPSVEAQTARDARRRCDAIILCAPRMPEQQLRELVTELHPIVLVNRRLDPSPLVSIDYVAGVRALVSEFVANGHRRIGYLGGPVASVSHGQRLAGIEESRRRYPGVGFVELPGGSRIDDGYAAADRVLASGVTALIVFNDMAAFGLLGALSERGVTVPEQLSVAGFDDVPYSRVSHPPLTTMSLPRLELGAAAWGRLHAMIEGDAPATAPVELAPTLVRRSSSGPAPAAEPEPAHLTVAGQRVASYADGTGVDPQLSPRPYLHPVATLGGTAVSDAGPEDHAHHLGVSLALPDVNGSSFWGGRTFVRDRGSVLLDNHGVQRRDGFDWADGRIAEALTWVGGSGVALATERRELRARAVSGGWALDWTSVITALDDLEIGSPATNGRAGAGYGGIFWRFPFAAATVFSEAGDGEQAVHGAVSPWLAIVDRPAGSGSVLLVQHGAAPWFVRVEEYVGAGPAVAWDTPRAVPRGGELRLGLTALVLDRVIENADDARELVRALGAAG